MIGDDMEEHEGAELPPDHADLMAAASQPAPEDPPKAKPDRWIEVYLDSEDDRWHWRTVANRGNLPDIAVKGASTRGYASKSGAKRAAKRENPGLPVSEAS